MAPRSTQIGREPGSMICEICFDKYDRREWERTDIGGIIQKGRRGY
jgi:hypothetical protein